MYILYNKYRVNFSGLGFGMGNILLPVSINQYFDKKRSTASGLSFSGACVGSFILPPIVEVLLNKYGLSGTYLFLSGFILNCVPAALLLKKPNFEIQKSNPKGTGNTEKQSIISGKKVKLYTTENDSHKPFTISSIEKGVSIIPKSDSKQFHWQNSKESGTKTNRSCKESIKGLSSLLLQNSNTSTSESSDIDKIFKNGKDRRQVVSSMMESKELSFNDKDCDSNSDISFLKETRSSSETYEKPILSEISSPIRALSTGTLESERVKPIAKTLKDGYANYGYQVEIDDLKLDISPYVIPQEAIQSRQDMQSAGNDIYRNPTYDNTKKKLSTEQYKLSRNNQSYLSKSSDWSDIDYFKAKHGGLPSVAIKEKDENRSKKSSCLGSFSIIFDPTFILIAVTNGLYNFTFVCMITVIVDYARDLNVGISNEKYVLMAFSIGDFIGHVGLGWITDCGYMTATSFAALCFACQGIVTSAMALADGFITLLILAVLYGLSEAGIIVIYPIIVAEYFGEEKQTVAIPTSNFLSGPVCLAVAPLIGKIVFILIPLYDTFDCNFLT